MTDAESVPESRPAGVAAPASGAPPVQVPYARFAADFRRRAVTVERVQAALRSLASRQLRFGPYSVVPLTSVEASGSLGEPTVRLADPDAPSFAVTVPAVLDLAVRVGALSRLRADVEIDLVLTPRPADGLFLYIDAAPVRAQDVRIALRGRGLGAAVSGLAGGLPTAITDEIRKQVAKQISNALRGASSRRARTIDIASYVEGAPRRPAPDRLRWVSDNEFGRQFVRRAVTVERVTSGFGALTGQEMTIGPLRVGPGGMAGVHGTGTVDTPVVVADDTIEGPAFAITLPLRLDLVVDLAREHRYRADIVARLRATPRPADDVRILIDIPPLDPADITVALTAADNLAAMLGRAGKMEDQISAQVRKIVNEQIGASSGRVVDVGAIVSGGAKSATPKAATPKARPRPRPSA